MKTYGILGQFGWFAFGTWAGAAFCILLSASETKEIKSWADDESGMQLLLAVYVFFALVFATLFATWLWIRARRKGRPYETPWLVPLISGIVYLPLLFGAIPLLIIVTGQGQGSRIGSAIYACICGLPIVSAEVSLFVARRCHRRKLEHNMSR